MALNQEKYLDDFTWTELNDVINFIRKAEGSASDHSYALQLLEINFKANPLDLIYHPDCWFNDEALFHARLTTEEIGGYLMKKSGRWLNDAPDIQLVYAIPRMFMINQVTIYHNPLIVRTAKTASWRFWQETGKTGNKPPENLPETRWLCFYDMHEYARKCIARKFTPCSQGKSCF
jgi:hypothetical protein